MSAMINGQLAQSLSVMDRALAYGDGIFRTFIVQKGAPLHWELQYQKLAHDAASIGIKCPPSETIYADIQHLFGDDTGVVKIIVSRGEGGRGYSIPTEQNPTRIVFKFSIPSYPESYTREGVVVHCCRLRLGQQPLLAGIKHLNRLENVLASQERTGLNFQEGLMLDQHGHVIEGTMSNLFARYQNRLLTPDLSQCGVAGVTRDQIISLAHKIDLEPIVKHIAYNDLFDADEVILCNSVIGVWQVIGLDQHQWSNQGLATKLKAILN
jgi:4-amino-4-deoxychorismate lyase